MAQHSHVPKFGNWDSDNIPYTTCFENARKEKAGVKMNPNDPKENPEMFMFGRGGIEIDDDRRASDAFEQNISEGHRMVSAHRRTPSDQYKSTASRTSVRSESGSEKSSSDSRRNSSRHRARLDRNKGLTESSNSLSPSVASVPKHARQRSGSQPSDDSHRRAPSIPKFGAWDETDPTSGESFTVIFNKVKEEKQNTSSKFPVVPPEPNTYSSNQKKQESSSSSRSKICCGLCFGGRE
ncbi:RPM1-interacting protein 4-like isoform X2 [Rhodamnia argentea]|uniref:RPM1-interacting protein 4-like isoform X2 n=1 Tax=Rhodamnia argentea TaxID=178133 RepID=A0ABM3HY99_9MYRT|nr:RPM1-interacting protein 4-like isoform X2 [Rhodamnia argentea]